MRAVRILLLTALLACAIPFPGWAQEASLGVTRVSADALVDFLRQEVDPAIFYVRDTTDGQRYTVRAPRKQFLDAAFSQLRENGYSVTRYDGSWYVLRGRGLALDLPAGFFNDRTERGSAADSLRGILGEQTSVMTFQNKIYEIGDPDFPKTSGRATVRGYVRDATSGEPITGVSVYEEGGKAFATTDAYGFYKLTMPLGASQLGFSGYSLEDLKLDMMIYGDGSLDVVMKEKVFTLKGAVVTSESATQHRTPQMGIEKVRVNVIKNVPVVFGEADALKVVMTLPGVKSVGEAASGYNVRGGSTDQNLILFNEGTIYNPNHMFGILSAFNTDVINDVELYKSSIPAQYGGRISSVLEVRSRDGNSKKLQGSLGLGLLTSRFHLEGPIIKDRTTFILGGRTTYSDWMLDLLSNINDQNRSATWLLDAIPKPSAAYSGGSASFQDLNAGISHRINANNTIQAYGYYSRDRFAFGRDTTFRYKNLNGSIKWHSIMGDRLVMTTVAGYDQYAYHIDNTTDPFASYRLTTGIDQAYAKSHFKLTLSDAHTLAFGLQATAYDLNPGEYSALGEESVLADARKLDNERAIEAAAYVGDTWDIGEKLSFDLGLRWSQFFREGGTRPWGGPEFRVSGKYSFNDNTSIKAGYNTMRQYIHMISNSINVSPTDSWRLSSDQIRPQTGWQAAAGFYRTMFEGAVDFSLEGYYKRVEHFIDYKGGAVLVMNPNLADDLIETENRSYGVEVMLKRTLGKLNGWVSYTWSRSMLRQMEDGGLFSVNNGKWYNAPYDKPHDVKVVANYKFTHRYSLSVNFDYSTGRPVTLPVGQYYYGEGVRLLYSARNAYRIPDYLRLDLAVIVEPGHYLKQLTHMSFTLGCYNVTGRKNPYSVYFTSDGNRITGHLLSVFAVPIPYVNFNLKF